MEPVNPNDVPADPDKRARTDDHKKPCQHCGQWIHTRGLKAHETYCDAAGDEAEKPGGPAPFGGAEGQQRGAEAGAAATNDPNGTYRQAKNAVMCPDCGNAKNGERPGIFASQTMLSAMRDRGGLDRRRQRLLERHKWYCNACTEVFGQ